MSYKGTDRRVHRVIVTQNREYHMRDRHCLGVRDRKSGNWMDRHQAIDCRLIGSSDLAFGNPSLNRSAVPVPGECVYLGDADQVRVLTSPVLRVRRAALHQVLSFYPEEESRLEAGRHGASDSGGGAVGPEESQDGESRPEFPSSEPAGLWRPLSVASLSKRSARSPFRM